MTSPDEPTVPDARRHRLRCERDSTLAEKILAEPLVQRAVRRVSDAERQGLPSVRRRLLATAVRLTPRMAPEIARAAERCAEILDVDAPIETFVYPSPDFNAAAVKPEAGRLFVLLSSSLVEAFHDAELAFVFGHELGHHAFGHHDLPIQSVLDGSEPPPPGLVLRVYAWSRYAEISADRAGAACAKDPDAVARALFRLASGLHGDLGRVLIEELAGQAEQMRYRDDEGTPKGDELGWFSTHPYSPLRLEAVRLFHRSELFVPGGIPMAELDAEVQVAMTLMEPSYLEERSEVAEVMRRLLFAGALAIANANGGISDEERAVFERFFGTGSLDDRLNIEAIEAALPARVQHAREEVPHARRIQVLRDLVLVAKADGVFRAEEVAVLREIAEGLEVADALVLHAMCQRCEID